MGDGEAEHEAGKRRRRRVLLPLLVGFVVAAIAIRGALSFFAADLFMAAVRQAASRGGLEIVLKGEPVVSASGFEAANLTVRTRGGDERLRADAVSGSARFFLHRPFLGVSLSLVGASATWSGADSGDDASPLLLPLLPAVFSRVEFKDARVDFGAGRVASIDAVVTAGEGGSLDVRWSRLEYSEESGERAAEKLAGTLRLTAAPSPSDVAPAPDPPRAIAAAKPGAPTPATGAGDAVAPAQALHVELVVESGAALVGSVLLDFAAHPLAASGVIASGDKGRLQGSDLAFALGRLLRGSGRVALARDRTLETADVTLASDDLMPAFVTLVREPFGGVAPALADAVLEGSGQVTLRLAAASRHSADATVSLSVRSLRTRSLAAESLLVELPWIGASLSGRAPRVGRLRAAKLSLLGLPWTGVDTAVTAAPGSLRAKAAQEWKAVGGTLRISDLVLEDDARGGPRAAADLRVTGFDLAGLGDALGVAGLAGSLYGDLGRVRIDADAVRAEGALDMETFGGSVRLSKLVVEHPFSRVPEFGLDAKVDGIDLGAVTARLGVGRVSGVLEGQVTGLVLAAGQPVSFDADLHTVKRRGVSQTVDVRAIVQLGVLGGGDSGSITGTLLKVIDRYRYSALGLRCRLRNDVFEIRGVETDGDKDYIVKGSLLPPSVSVVSHSQVVSFSEMLKRVQRIASIDEGGSPNVPSQ